MKLGSWFRDHPKVLERAYQAARWTVKRCANVIERLGYERVNSWLIGPEELGKRIVFDCQMCGQCVLHATGMTCPMTCPKDLRNGPCGGVRQNGRCEVFPDKLCIWVEAYDRSQLMPLYGREIMVINPPLNRSLEGSSAWINLLAAAGNNMPAGWKEAQGEADAGIHELGGQD